VVDGRRIRLVVLTHNGGENVERCFEHLEALTWPREELELVLVDNASVDGSGDRIAGRFPQVRVVRMPSNRGFPANNVALQDLDRVRYVGLINDDAFVTSDFLAPLVATLDADDEAGAACPRMLLASQYLEVTMETTAERPARGDPRELGVKVSGLRVDGENRWERLQFAQGGHGREFARAGSYEWTSGRSIMRVPLTRDQPLTDEVEIRLSALEPKELLVRSGSERTELRVTREPRWHVVPLEGKPFDVVNNAGSLVYTSGYGADRGFGQRDGAAFDDEVDVFAWCGGAVLLRPTYLQDAGLFDERFFLYYEDTDLSWRGRGRGWRYRYAPRSVIHHLHASTTVEGSRRFAYFTERNRLLMLVKNAPADLVTTAIRRFTDETYDAARRDVAGAIANARRPNALPVERRLHALAGFAALAPAMLASRAEIRARQLVDDDELVKGLTVG
jgi:GT2 family glycosyltransferase